MNSDQTKTCTINNIAAQPGVSEVFSGSLYSGTAETGQLLGRGSTTFTIQLAQANNVTIQMSPIVSELGLTLSSSASSPVFSLALHAGSAQNFPVTVQAYDAEGYLIPTPSVGAQYLNSSAVPFTITVNVQLASQSPAGTITFSPNSITSPSSPSVTGSYSGATLGSGASISAGMTTSDPNIFIDPPVTVTN